MIAYLCKAWISNVWASVWQNCYETGHRHVKMACQRRRWRCVMIWLANTSGVPIAASSDLLKGNSNGDRKTPIRYYKIEHSVIQIQLRWALKILTLQVLFEDCKILYWYCFVFYTVRCHTGSVIVLPVQRAQSESRLLYSLLNAYTMGEWGQVPLSQLT